ncbi:Molybdopterin-guanine dinucleotide biosynthesis protein A [Pseudomonas syringae pv. actinidiae]|uniref:Molybdopterin-guanine dinucleotide biosynthesis protein A n=1 Tax=Pseudomonas syringae pv. actinidiae TaxID=103796 RepID=A0AAN4TQL8_PSESF|nr:Molybdopterin-guanine dinucleotide biosynthesis protein A [Pseudomonas syringae pv. actinidiae]
MVFGNEGELRFIIVPAPLIKGSGILIIQVGKRGLDLELLRGESTCLKTLVEIVLTDDSFARLRVIEELTHRADYTGLARAVFAHQHVQPIVKFYSEGFAKALETSNVQRA